MSQREILAIAIKVFSLWFLCWLFINVTSFIPMIASIGSWQGHEIPVWVYIAICSSFLLAGFIISKLLFSVSNSVLNKLSSENDISLSNTDHRFIFQVSGLFFIVSSLTWLPASVAFLFAPNIEGVNLGYLLDPFGKLLQLFIGIWLVAHPGWWGLLFRKMRGRV